MTTRDRDPAAGATRLRAPALAAALASALALAGCGSPTATGPSPTTSATPTAAVSPGASTSSDDVISPPHVVVGDPLPLLGSLEASPVGEARLEVTEDDDGSVRLDVHVPEGATPVVAAINAPGVTFDVRPDGSLVVSDDGVPVAGAQAPRGETADGLRQRASLEAWGDGVKLTVDRAPGSDGRPEATVQLWFTDEAVTDLDWGEREGGRSLAVTPSAWARARSDAAEELVWAAVSEEDGADGDGMRDQLLCHLIGAPDKDTWNLEPWRPDVGLAGVIAARCNPTEGGE